LYGKQGLVVLAFPCNQFFSLSPGNGTQNLDTIRYVNPGNNFITQIDYWFDTIDTNGASENPVFTWLKSFCPLPALPLFQTGRGVSYTPSWQPVSISDVLWNFEKYLIDRNGIPFKRFAPHTYPTQLEKDIQQLMFA